MVLHLSVSSFRSRPFVSLYFPPALARCGRQFVRFVLKLTSRDSPEADEFGLKVFVEAFCRSLTAKTRLLDAAERHDLVGENAIVDADHAGIDALGDAPGAAQDSD